MPREAESLASITAFRSARRRCRAVGARSRLRNGDTYARLAAGLAIGTCTAWRYVREAADLLALLADNAHAAVLRARRLAYTILGRHPRQASSSGPHPRCPVPRMT